MTLRISISDVMGLQWVAANATVVLTDEYKTIVAN